MQHQSKYNILTRGKSSTFLFGLYLFTHTGVQHLFTPTGVQHLFTHTGVQHDFISDDVHVFQQ